MSAAAQANRPLLFRNPTFLPTEAVTKQCRSFAQLCFQFRVDMSHGEIIKRLLISDSPDLTHRVISVQGWTGQCSEDDAALTSEEWRMQSRAQERPFPSAKPYYPTNGKEEEVNPGENELTDWKCVRGKSFLGNSRSLTSKSLPPLRHSTKWMWRGRKYPPPPKKFFPNVRPLTQKMLKMKGGGGGSSGNCGWRVWVKPHKKSTKVDHCLLHQKAFWVGSSSRYEAVDILFFSGTSWTFLGEAVGGLCTPKTCTPRFQYVTLQRRVYFYII